MTASREASALPWGRICDALGSGLVVMDGDGRVVYWNAWMVRHSGVPVERAEGETIEAIFGDAMALPFRRALRNVLAHRLPVVLSNVLHRDPLPLYRRGPSAENDGETTRIPQSVMLMPIPSEDGAALCLIQITDTSMFVKRERVLQSNSDRLSKEAVIDGLTGVYNRKYFNQALPLEMNRSVRQEMPLSVIMLDVDCFKKYNDTYGHPAGDRVLVSIVTAVHSQLNRAADVLARYGGEEFVVILSACDKQGAMLVAEKIRQAISDLRIPHIRSDVADHITVSLGISTGGPGHCISGDELVETADRALYAAKHGGRNAVHWLPVDGATPLAPQS